MMNVGTILNDNFDVTEQQGKSNSQVNDTDAEGVKINMNGSNDDITIVKSSHDKDKAVVQWSNIRLFENNHELQKTNENNKALKVANDLLTKELKMYKGKVQNEHLKFVYKILFDSIKKSRPPTQNLNKPQNEAEKLKSDVSEVVDKKFEHIMCKDDSSLGSITKSNTSELEKESGENICKNAKCDLQINIVELEKVLIQKTKDFDDVKLELSNRTTKFKAYFEKLANMKVVLERKLARKVDDSKAGKDQFL
nr:hypothetical protein [Tanacetum cinerariifolium]